MTEDPFPVIVRTPRDLGAAVRAQRRKLTLSQASLAKQAGVSRQWIIGLEKGKPGTELSLVLRTLRVLGLGLEVLPEAHGPDTGADVDEVLARARGRT